MAALSREIPLSLELSTSDRPATERRKRVRLHVHWPIRFLRQGSVDGLETTTLDLSSEGFHIKAKAPFVSGESWTCALSVPANDPKDASRMLLVECSVRVVWARPVDEGFYRVGCHIENYRFLDAILSDPSLGHPSI